MSFTISKGLGSLNDGTLNTTFLSAELGAPGHFIPVAFEAEGIIVAEHTITVQFNRLAIVTGPALLPTSYPITPTDGGFPATVTAVSAVGATLVLTVTEHTNGKNYILGMPTVGITDVDANLYQGPFLFPYAGVGSSPHALIARSVDARTFEITFDRAMNAVEATNPANYSVSPTLKVVSVSKVLDSVYRATTARQSQGVLYTVTVSNIHDEDGNEI